VLPFHSIGAVEDRRECQIADEVAVRPASAAGHKLLVDA
jgi:hypothetical protein